MNFNWQSVHFSTFLQKVIPYISRNFKTYQVKSYLKSKGFPIGELIVLGKVQIKIDDSSKIYLGDKVVLENCTIILTNNSELFLAQQTVVRGVSLFLNKGAVLKTDKHVLIEQIPPYLQKIQMSSNSKCLIGEGSRIRCSIKASASGEIVIGKRTFINQGSELRCQTSITIGDYVLVSYEVDIFDNNTHSTDWRERREAILNSPMNEMIDKFTPKTQPITVGSDCWIGKRAAILKGVNIGERSIVALGSVITISIPSDCLAYGNPSIYKPLKLTDVQSDQKN